MSEKNMGDRYKQNFGEVFLFPFSRGQRGSVQSAPNQEANATCWTRGKTGRRDLPCRLWVGGCVCFPCYMNLFLSFLTQHNSGIFVSQNLVCNVIRYNFGNSKAFSMRRLKDERQAVLVLLISTTISPTHFLRDLQLKLSYLLSHTDRNPCSDHLLWTFLNLIIFLIGSQVAFCFCSLFLYSKLHNIFYQVC